MIRRGEIKERARTARREQRAPAILLLFVYMLMGMAAGIINAMFEPLGTAPYTIAYWVTMLVLGVMMINMLGSYVKIYERRPASVGELYTGFGTRFLRKLGGYLWMCLWLFIWALPSIAVSTALAYLSGALMVWQGPWGFHASFELVGWAAFLLILSFIPVIIKGLSYFMMPYLLGRHPEVKALQALRLSKRMTNGYKGRIFVMHLSFIGWMILVILPVVVGTFFGGVSILAGSSSGVIGWLILGFLGSAALFIVVVGPYMYIALAGQFVELRDHAIANGIVTREELCMETAPIFTTPPMPGMPYEAPAAFTQVAPMPFAGADHNPPVIPATPPPPIEADDYDEESDEEAYDDYEEEDDDLADE